MAGQLLDEECSFSQLPDLDNMSLLDVFDLNCSLTQPLKNEVKSSSFSITSDLEPTNLQTSGDKLLNDTSVWDNGLEDSKLSLFKRDPKQYYYDHIKPACPELECSYSEIFAHPHPRGEEELRAFALARVQEIAENVKMKVLNKSLSCPNLQKLAIKQPIEDDSSRINNQKFNFTNSKNDYLNNETFDTHNLNSSKFPITNNETKMNRFASGSVEVLNYSHFNDSFTASSKPYETHMDSQYNNTFTLQKAYSSSCIPSKNDSIMDIEIKLEDSVPSEDEVDEMGLPVKRFIYTNTPVKKIDDLSQTIVKYRNFRASIGEPNLEDAVEPKTSVTSVREPPLLLEVGDTHLKKSQATTSKGPLKALMPLQNMTKQMGVKIMSPFKKKKEKKIDFTSKNTSNVLTESFEVATPMAASTPTGGRASRRDSISGNTSFVRSVSEGRTTPVKKQYSGPILNVSYTKPDQNQQAKMNTTKTISNPVAKPLKPAVTKNVNQSLLAKPKGKLSIARRPSTAPANPLVSIKAPLTTKRFSVNQSTANQSILPKLNPPRTSVAKTSPNNIRSLIQNNSKRLTQVNPISSLKKPIPTVTKLRRPTSTFDKENKIK